MLDSGPKAFSHTKLHQADLEKCVHGQAYMTLLQHPLTALSPHQTLPPHD